MAIEKENINPNREKALGALLTTVSITDAAKQSGLSVRTIQRFLEDEIFKFDLRTARRAIFEEAIGQISSAVGKAHKALEDALTSDRVSDRIRAAQIILEQSNKSFERTEILERIEQLELSQAGIKK